MPKTFEEINEKIRKGEAVVVTAEEIIGIVEKDGLKKAAKEVDVVTTATFGPMCSSGAMLNIGHTTPRMKISKAWLNNVPVYAGLAAVDFYLGATELSETDPGNTNYPGKFNYGGGHVIQDLIDKKDVELRAESYGTSEYPRKHLRSWMNINDINECVLVNFRNAYQNYNVAVNEGNETIYTYLGVLKPNLGNANYCSAGQLSPLLNDPYFKTIGIGTRIFLGGTQGYVFWNGSQHDPSGIKREGKTLKGGGGTLSVVGDMKQMSSKYIKAVSMLGYGVSLSVGIGVPIPILNEEILSHAAVRDEEILAPIVDYGHDYALNKPNRLGYTSYKQLKSGRIILKNKEVPTGSLSSYPKALEIAELLKKQIAKGEFLLTEKVQPLPAAESGYKFRLFSERSVKNGN
ncbi:homocysteine biosynthesis protein [Candidatus Woesearchaeota archaeon]|nr:homocysteine biosynthesis protein [Candidatus Woesearchaeota archaeon]